MKVSISWLKELVNLNISVDKLIQLLPLRSVSIKEVTEDFIELDMKGYNRADLLSIRGVAQEVAAITDSTLKFDPNLVGLMRGTYEVEEARVKVESPDLAPVYCLAKIENLKVEQSNEIWVKKLSDSGIRSVNNVADVTNLIMLEYGQPMHAFDARAVKDEEIVVRTARRGERITTLDGKTRDLGETDLLIADPLNALGIAGVMGGKDSEVNESTTTILLEAAIFDPVNIKKTVSALGLPSEASKRFQHGLTKKRLLQALDAAIKMYEELGGKVTAITMVGNFEDQKKSIKLTKGKLDLLVGVKFEDKQVVDYLEKLNFKVAEVEGGWIVEPPYWRLDINLEEDVIEEVARMYGYEKIPAEAVSESEPLQDEDPIFKAIQDLRQKLVDLGLTEVQTYSFYSTDVLDALSVAKEKLVKVANPISAETEYLKEFLWPNLVETVGKNMRKGYKDIAIFEIGKVFSETNNGPKEQYRLAIALMNGSDNPLTELYQMVQKITDTQGVKLEHLGGVQSLFHPKRYLVLRKDGKQLGHLAELHLRVLNYLGIEKRVAVLEIGLKELP